MLENIVKFTKQEMELPIQSKKYANQSCTGETSVVEISALLGLLISLGAKKQNHTLIETPWHNTRGIRITRSVRACLLYTSRCV